MDEQEGSGLTILEQLESGGAEYLGYLDEYIKDYQERNAADDE